MFSAFVVSLKELVRDFKFCLILLAVVFNELNSLSTSAIEPPLPRLSIAALTALISFPIPDSIPLFADLNAESLAV